LFSHALNTNVSVAQILTDGLANGARHELPKMQTLLSDAPLDDNEDCCSAALAGKLKGIPSVLLALSTKL
jgi:hypothetical protein